MPLICIGPSILQCHRENLYVNKNLLIVFGKKKKLPAAFILMENCSIIPLLSHPNDDATAPVTFHDVVFLLRKIFVLLIAAF